MKLLKKTYYYRNNFKPKLNMKKLIYIALILITTGLVSCTEENIQPQSGNGGAGETQKY